jgi:hypothetical protein
MPEPQKNIKLVQVTRNDRQVVVTIQNDGDEDAKCYVGIFFQSVQGKPNFKPVADPANPESPQDANGNVIPFGPKKKRVVTFDPPKAWLDRKGKQGVTIIISLTDPKQEKSADKPTDHNTSTHNFFV